MPTFRVEPRDYFAQVTYYNSVSSLAHLPPILSPEQGNIVQWPCNVSHIDWSSPSLDDRILQLENSPKQANFSTQTTN